MKNDSTSFFENNHFANSYVYDISISHVPAYFGLHWHHYIEIVLAQDNGIIYEVNGETFPLKPGDLLFIWPGELHAVSTTNREHRLIMLQLDADFLEKRVDFQSVAYLFYQIRLLNQNNFPEIEKLRGFLTELRRLSLSGISFLFCSAKISPCRPKLPHRKKQAIPHRYTARWLLHVPGSQVTAPNRFPWKKHQRSPDSPAAIFPSCSAHTPASPSRISSPGNGSISPKTC